MIGAAKLKFLAPAAALLLTAACGDANEQERAKKAALALQDYYHDSWRPPSPEWSVTNVNIGKTNNLTVNVAVASQALSKTIMERSRFEQMEIARMACPPVTHKVWNTVAKKQTVGVALSGVAGHIMNAQCKRP